MKCSDASDSLTRKHFVGGFHQVTEKKKQEVKEAVKTLFAVMKSRKKARDIMTRKVRAIVDAKTLLICCPKLNITTRPVFDT